jgi:hypothetical protein
VHGGNFIRRSLLVKQYGAILGMQMQRNRTVGANILAQVRRYGARLQRANPEPRDSGFDAFASPRNDKRNNGR